MSKYKYVYSFCIKGGDPDLSYMWMLSDAFGNAYTDAQIEQWVNDTPARGYVRIAMTHEEAEELGL